MTSQQRVQEYLDKHKIGALFEDLMGRVVSDQPDEPFGFLIHILERKASRMGYKSSTVRRSTGDLSKGRPSSPDPAMRKSMPAWGSSGAVAKDRGYDKPWSTNTKRAPVKASSKDPRRSSASGARSPSKAVDVDDLWGARTAPPGGRKNDWKDVNEDEELLFMSRGYRGPRRIEESDELAGEFKVAKVKVTRGSRDETAYKPTYKKNDLRSSQARQRQKYEQLLRKGAPRSGGTANDSGFEDERDLDPDNAVELTEDADALRSEGVYVKRSGAKNIKTVRRSAGVRRGVEPPVRVSICARCAKVMAGGEPSEPAEGTQYGQLPQFEGDTDFDVSRPQSSARVSAFGSDDEEFESVSQVTGPRKPVWDHQDSDNESIGGKRTGRTSTASHMFKSGAKSSKGRPMYSARGDPLAATDLYRSFTAGASGPELKSARQQDLRATWSPGMGESEDDDDDQTLGFRAEGGAWNGRSEGGGWNVPPTDYDSEASTEFTYGRGGRKGQAPGGRDYMGAF